MAVYNARTIEKKWQKAWEKEKIFQAQTDTCLLYTSDAADEL